jgi:hypothetical protein
MQYGTGHDTNGDSGWSGTGDVGYRYVSDLYDMPAQACWG